MMRVASFFSGIGGFDLGFQNIGMNIVFQCEKNKFSQQVLQKHWPNVPRHGDINTLDVINIPDSELWCGGFPCQDLSLANNGKRQGLDGKYSGLFFKFKELIQQRLPKWVVMENVPGLLNSQKGADFSLIIHALDELGYGVAWRVLDSKFFGTPQRRRRVYIVASYQSRNAAEVLFDNRRIAITLKTSRGQEEAITQGFGNSNPEANLYSIQNAAIGRNHKAGPQGKGYRCDGETWTLDSRGSSDVVCTTHDPFRIRETTNFPRWVDGSRFTSLGNAVTISVIEWIGRGIIEVELASK